MAAHKWNRLKNKNVDSRIVTVGEALALILLSVLLAMAPIVATVILGA